jgi:hypothetical protein
LGLHFSGFLRFSMDFTRFGKSHLLFEIRFYAKLPETFFLLQIGPWFTNKALERRGALQCCPRGMVGGGSPKFRRSGDRDRLGKGKGRWGAHLGSVWGRRWGWGCGSRARRRQAARALRVCLRRGRRSAGATRGDVSR